MTDALRSIFVDRCEKLHLALIELFRNPERHSVEAYKSYLMDALLAISDTDFKVTEKEMDALVRLLMSLDDAAVKTYGLSLHWIVRSIYIDKLDQLRGQRTSSVSGNVVSVDFSSAKPLHH